jgi:hypothetical protein
MWPATLKMWPFPFTTTTAVRVGILAPGINI